MKALRKHLPIPSVGFSLPGAARARKHPKRFSPKTGPQGTGLAILFLVFSVLRKNLRFFIFHGGPIGPSVWRLSPTVSGPQLLSLLPFGPLPAQPRLYSPASLPFRASAPPAFGCLPPPGCCNYCGTPSASTQEHTHIMRIPGRRNPRTKTCR